MVLLRQETQPGGGWSGVLLAETASGRPAGPS